MPTDVRLTQLARILGLSLDGNDEAAVRAAASARPEVLAEAFFRDRYAIDGTVYFTDTGRNAIGLAVEVMRAATSTTRPGI